MTTLARDVTDADLVIVVADGEAHIISPTGRMGPRDIAGFLIDLAAYWQTHTPTQMRRPGKDFGHEK